MMKPYKTVKGYSKDEIIINKSTFIGYSNNVNDEDDAKDFIQKINKKHYDATHNCYAYMLGDTMSIAKCSDDGEPSGTAGVPILETLKKENLTNTVIVVTRYFGGIKLGSGGLIRAYTKGATIAINSNTIVEKLIYTPLNLTVDYSYVGVLQNYIEDNNILISPTTFLEKVTFNLYLPSEKIDSYIKTLTNLTNGKGQITTSDNIYVNKIKDKIALD